MPGARAMGVQWVRLSRSAWRPGWQCRWSCSLSTASLSTAAVRRVSAAPVTAGFALYSDAPALGRDLAAPQRRRTAQPTYCHLLVRSPVKPPMFPPNQWVKRLTPLGRRLSSQRCVPRCPRGRPLPPLPQCSRVAGVRLLDPDDPWVDDQEIHAEELSPIRTWDPAEVDRSLGLGACHSRRHDLYG